MTVGYHILHILHTMIERHVDFVWDNAGLHSCFNTLKAVDEIHRCYPSLGYETILMSVGKNVYIKEPWGGRDGSAVWGKTACARELDGILTVQEKLRT